MDLAADTIRQLDENPNILPGTSSARVPVFLPQNRVLPGTAHFTLPPRF